MSVDIESVLMEWWREAMVSKHLLAPAASWAAGLPLSYAVTMRVCIDGRLIAFSSDSTSVQSPSTARVATERNVIGELGKSEFDNNENDK